MKEYYKVLGIEENATIEEIESSYKKLEKKYKGNNSNTAKNKLKEIRKAHEELTKKVETKEETKNQEEKVERPNEETINKTIFTKERIIPFGIGLVLGLFVMMLFFPERIAKLKSGEQVAVTVNEKDNITWINPKARDNSKNINYYAFKNRDFSELNDILNEISKKETELIEKGYNLDGIKSFNRTIWLDISKESNAIEGVFEDFDYDARKLRIELRGKFSISDPDRINFDYNDYFKTLSLREREIDKENDSVLVVINGKNKEHKLSIETVRHYIAFKYAYKCAKKYRYNRIDKHDFISILNNASCLLSANDIVSYRNSKATVEGATWTPVRADEIYEKLQALASWVTESSKNRGGGKIASY